MFDAEAVAALQGLRTASISLQAKHANNVYICLDNLEVARSLGSPTNTSSQQIFAQFMEEIKIWQKRERLPHTCLGSVIVRWVPGHAGVAGNERADQEAKAAATRAAIMTPQEDTPGTLAYVRRLTKEKAMQAFKDYWMQSTST